MTDNEIFRIKCEELVFKMNDDGILEIYVHRVADIDFKKFNGTFPILRSEDNTYFWTRVLAKVTMFRKGA